MTFYKSIADYYDNIFPFKPAQLEFVKQSFQSLAALKLLDIGCGTGLLSIELGKAFQKVIAIDLDKAMLDKAKSRETENVDFQKLDMLKIAQTYGKAAFDCILCFGNTLVHLDNAEQIEDFFRQAKQVLKPNGKLLFQIINYDRILDKNVNSLPHIENEAIKFARNYNYDSSNHLIRFDTRLFIKLTSQMIENSISLYPLRKTEIEKMILEAGFSNLRFFGDFRRNELEKNSQPLVAVVER